jgi:hypothetical protein
VVYAGANPVLLTWGAPGQGSQFDDSPIISPSSIDCSGPPVASIPQESVDSQLLLDDLPIDSSFSIDLEA